MDIRFDIKSDEECCKLVDDLHHYIKISAHKSWLTVALYKKLQEFVKENCLDEDVHSYCSLPKEVREKTNG